MNLLVGSDRPSAWVVRFVPLLPPGEVLDLACGNGRHARLLHDLRHPVLALDRNPDVLAALAATGIATLRHDLESGAHGWPFESGRFAGIIVANYLHRPLFPRIFDSLAPRGLLIYETFAQGQERFGKPSNPDFLLAPGELLDRVRAYSTKSLQVLAFEDGYVADPKPAMVQRICVRKVEDSLSADSMRLF